MTAYEKAKKKHQSRLKKLEAQMMAMVERHDTQVRLIMIMLKSHGRDVRLRPYVAD